MKKIIRILSISLFIVVAPQVLSAQGGMWPAHLLEQRAADLAANGLKISTNELYSEKSPALNDAVLLFDGGCTGEIVSAQGLFFTNHHCGYDLVQKLSTEKNNYLIDGFWAMNQEQELPCKDAKVEILRKVQNVTDYILAEVTDSMNESKRMEIINRNIKFLQTAYEKASKYKAVIKSYYDGNEYWVSLYEVFEDIRLVGFPPNGIGKFGGDTDNWMWPRHTGDFGVFRIYADKDNKGAKYNASNKPYHPAKHFAINTKGVKEGDLAMVYGYPGRTTQYYTSYQVDQVQNIINPIRINVRGARLGAWDKTMRAQPKVFLQYAAKQSSLSNGWKKWQGEVRGLALNDVIGKKRTYEQSLQNRYDLLHDANADLLPKMQTLINANNHHIAASEFIREAGLGIEAIAHNDALDRIMKLYRKDSLSNSALRDSLNKIVESKSSFYKNYDVITDQIVFDTLMPIYLASQPTGAVPDILFQYKKNAGNTMSAWRSYIYDNSIILDELRLQSLARNANPRDSIKIIKDPAYLIYKAIINHRDKNIQPHIKNYSESLSKYSRQYTKAIMDINAGNNKLYPDANQTLRLSYGPVKGIKPYGTNHYSYITTLDEVIQKTNPSIEEFNTPAKLIDLYNTKNYGRWAWNGTVPVAFISQNHTSGGNSGSPVLNAKGELIGINFDRIWDGTMSDIYYDPNLCRNIAVDIRYVMFIIEKFGNAGWLLNEMTLK